MFSYTVDNHHVNIMLLNGCPNSITATEYNLKTVLIGMSLLFSSENVPNFSKHGNEFLMALF